MGDVLRKTNADLIGDEIDVVIAQILGNARFAHIPERRARSLAITALVLGVLPRLIVSVSREPIAGSSGERLGPEASARERAETAGALILERVNELLGAVPTTDEVGHG